MTEFKTNFVREHYNTQIGERYSDDYEFHRWFDKTRTWMDYHMTYRSLKHHLKDTSFNNCFELGPGPGTWTKLLYRRNPHAKFMLLDISKEMKKQFHLEMRDSDNIEYNIGDFLEYETKENLYDLFFSSRAIEYLSDKKESVGKIKQLLKPGGTCIIITKNPNLFTLRKNGLIKLHQDQISASDLCDMFAFQGFHSIQVFPVIVRLPLIDRLSLKISKRVFERVYKKNVKGLPFYAESYCIVCRKKS